MRSSLPKLLLCAALGLSSIAVGLMPARPASAYPKPSIYPVSWDLKFTHATPKRIVVTTPGTTVPLAYWYMTFTVTNLSEQEQLFLPTFEMVTNDGKVIRSEKSVPSAVFDEIKKRERKSGLLPLEKVSGRLLIGEDQARDGVAIWPEPSTRMGTFDLYVGGLSGEAVFVKDGEEVTIKDWTKTSEDDRKKLNTLHKTLHLTYQIPGDEIRPEEDVIVSKGEESVMR